MTREFAHAFIARNGPLMTEAIEVIIGKRPETPDNPNDATRPFGVIESEEKRRGYGHCAGCGTWLALEGRTYCLSDACQAKAGLSTFYGQPLGEQTRASKPVGSQRDQKPLAAENNPPGIREPGTNRSSGVGSAWTAGPHACAECGVELMAHEVAREFCDDCVRLKLGLR